MKKLMQLISELRELQLFSANKTIISVLLLICYVSPSMSQTRQSIEYNKYDILGRKNGYWYFVESDETHKETK